MLVDIPPFSFSVFVESGHSTASEGDGATPGAPGASRGRTGAPGQGGRRTASLALCREKVGEVVEAWPGSE